MTGITDREWSKRKRDGRYAETYQYVYRVHDGVGREVGRKELLDAGLYSGTVEYKDQRIAVEASVNDGWRAIWASDEIDELLT